LFLSRQGLDVSFDRDFGHSFQWDIPLLEGYRFSFLPNLRKTSDARGFFSLLNLSVVPSLRDGRYDALLIHGYEHFAKLLAVFAAKSCNTKLLLHGESHLDEPRTPIRRSAKRLVLPGLFRQFDAFAYIGTRNRRYYEFYGAHEPRLFFAPYCVDNNFFSAAAAKAAPNRSALRRALGISDDAPVIIFAGKLTSLKQPDLLLDAFVEVRKKLKCHLLFVGDGALRPTLEKQSNELAPGDVHFAGFVNQSRIPEMYACGDIFVLPSLWEPWGLVVNEAMAAGLPVIVSDKVGCSPDLVEEGGNGYVFGHDNRDQLADRIASLVASASLRAGFSARSKQIISRWSLEAAADGIVQAARAACGPDPAESDQGLDTESCLSA
jgi:glycosyltransferase involved in cell wall biosynthesis